jgi:hypothetical protein
MKKTPLSQVKERFGSKPKLVEALQQLTTEQLWIDRLGEAKGLQRVSNAKLLALYDLLTDVKERFGSREKLVDTILELEKRGADDGLRSRLRRYPVARLLDLHRAAARRAARREAARPLPKRKVARSRKAKAKARAARA